MSLQLLWRTFNSFNFVDPVDGLASQVRILPGLEQNIYDPNELEELLLWQESQAEKEIKAKREDARQPMTKQQQHELGALLKENKATNVYKAENNHGRYWPGVH